jgi:predicted transcriptional regulator
VQHGTRLDYEGLQREAKRSLDNSDYTQQAIAERLGVTRTSVAKAVTQVGPKFQRLQMRILETLTDYEVERREHVEFLLREKGRREGERVDGHLLASPVED